MTNKITLKSKA